MGLLWVACVFTCLFCDTAAPAGGAAGFGITPLHKSGRKKPRGLARDRQKSFPPGANFSASPPARPQNRRPRPGSGHLPAARAPSSAPQRYFRSNPRLFTEKMDSFRPGINPFSPGMDASAAKVVLLAPGMDSFRPDMDQLPPKVVPIQPGIDHILSGMKPLPPEMKQVLPGMEPFRADMDQSLPKRGADLIAVRHSRVETEPCSTGERRAAL